MDVLSQNQILGLIKELKKNFGLTNILISHDLSVVHELSDIIAVMYLGRIVEFGPAEEIFHQPRHPYTRALFDSIPKVGSQGMEELKTLDGQIPSAIDPPSGCAFHTRCPYASEECGKTQPAETHINPEHYVCCHKIRISE